MEKNKLPLIIVDPGHGGWDNGASWEGRLEKDDNLRLGREVAKQLREHNIPVQMTRDTDVYVTLTDRADMANQAGADLFISLHRNSYPEQTPTTMGVENYIYLTAPEDPDAVIARLVLDRVVEAGVQADRGVSRGDYYVLRETTMPSMLLEMGFIINEEDNRLFDEKLHEYAAAIVSAVAEYYGLSDKPQLPGCPDPRVMQAQLLMNTGFGLDIPLSGVFDKSSLPQVVAALQMALNTDLGAKLKVDGILGARTLAALRSVPKLTRGAVIYWLQLALMLNGQDPGRPDGIIGPLTRAALTRFQEESGLPPDGEADQATIQRLAGQ
ncbi:MAG: N-acetylmuramoyl-L-alanine amidase [Oscillospiraceae bacterium]|nr:N-acetylmuramoyl-L-alanine amidase [Oscillospiraceae bacterium]